MIIAFSGTMGSGKSTAVEALKFLTKDTHKVHLVKFAQPLYDMQEMIYRRIASVHTRPEDFVKDRKLLQWLGSDWGRDTIQKDLWVSLWKAEAAAKAAEGYLVVCDDLRFDNEAQAVQDLGGVMVKINAKSIQDRSVVTNGIANHSSEQGVDLKYFHYSIDNNGTKSEYQDNLKYLFYKIFVTNFGNK
jgi:energy-coupling factor transporter ATP-binding protein EcfA2